MRLLLLCLTLLAPTAAWAAERPVGEMHRTIPLASAAARRSDHKPELNVTIWYPAKAGTKVAPVVIGPPSRPLFEIADMALDAAPAPGKRPVILLSHGFGGTAENMGWLGAGLAEGGYIVVSVDHPGNNTLDKTLVGAVAWWERPRDMIAALAAMRQDKTFGPLIDPDKVGVAGFSIGGMTALALAGGRIDPHNYDAFCKAEPGDGVCQPPPEMADAPKIAREDGVRMLGLTEAEAHAGEGGVLPGVRGVLSIAPPSQMLAPASLADIHAPVVLIAGEDDTTVPPAHHAALAAKAIAGSKLVIVPGVAHYSFMAYCTEAGREAIDVCRLAVEQATAHQIAVKEGLTLFRRTLGSPRD